MNRNDLADNIKEQCDETIKLFFNKNSDYGENNDACANFRKTAARLGEEGKNEKQRMIKTLMVLQDKHLVGLSHTLGTGKEDNERFLDVAIYALIARSILQEETNID